MCTWSVVCDNDSHFIVDYETGNVYAQREAEDAPPKTKKRLVMRSVSQGNFVLTLEECDMLLKERGL